MTSQQRSDAEKGSRDGLERSEEAEEQPGIGKRGGAEGERLGDGDERFAFGIAERAAGVEVFIAAWALVGCALAGLLKLPPGVATARTAALENPRQGFGTNLCHECEYTIAMAGFKRETWSVLMIKEGKAGKAAGARCGCRIVRDG